MPTRNSFFANELQLWAKELCREGLNPTIRLSKQARHRTATPALLTVQPPALAAAAELRCHSCSSLPLHEGSTPFPVSQFKRHTRTRAWRWLMVRATAQRCARQYSHRNNPGSRRQNQKYALVKGTGEDSAHPGFTSLSTAIFLPVT